MADDRMATSVDRRIGQKIKTRRLEINMSQERLAELLGITFQQVQKYEKGVNRVAASRLWDISIALDVFVSHFFEGLPRHTGRATDDSPIMETLSTPEGVELMGLYGQIPDGPFRRRVLDFVRDLVALVNTAVAPVAKRHKNR